MIFNLKKKINKILFNFTGYQIRKIDKTKEYFKDEPHLDKDFFKVCSKIEKIYQHDCIHETNYTAYNLVKNATYQNIEGCIIECGVFQGEKISVIIETLKLLNVYDKNIYVIDTFQGMTEPSSSDYQVIDGNKMREKDMLCTLEKVKKNISFSNYPSEKIKFIKIDVRNTNDLRNIINEPISILRLDTDFYDSTLSILEALYEKVVKGGYLIHDDYGHWRGHYEACQKFYATNFIKPLLIRTCRKERIEIK